MKVVKLGESLYEVRCSAWSWSLKRDLIRGLQEIQGYGKIVTVTGGFISKTLSTCYVVVTS